MWKVILLCTFVGLTAGKLATFENHHLIRFIPQTHEHVNILKGLYKYSTSTWLDFWNMPSTKNAHVNVMISLDDLKTFQRLMQTTYMGISALHHNVQMLINTTINKDRSSYFDFNSFHTLQKIYENMDDMAEQYPDNVKIIVGGTTYEGRQIKGVKISFKPNNPGVFLEGGINAREWMPPAVVMYIMHQLLTSEDVKIKNMAESNDWYIFPVFNPDGYVYTHTMNRMWIKSRKPYNESFGSNLNMNWDYKWNNKKEFRTQFSDVFAGTEPFSEIETKSMSEYIESIKDNFFAYFSFNSQSSDVTYPPDDITNDAIQYDFDMTDIVTKPFSVPYRKAVKQWGWTKQERKIAKNIVKMNDLDSGSSVSYIKGIYNKPLVLAYGLENNYSMGSFLQSPDQIVWFGEEAVYALESMLDEAKQIFSIDNK